MLKLNLKKCNLWYYKNLIKNTRENVGNITNLKKTYVQGVTTLYQETLDISLYTYLGGISRHRHSRHKCRTR